MPTYEYQCKNCQHRLEIIQKITESPLKDCPQCGKPTLQRGPGGGIGISFVGSGWYKTDYATTQGKEESAQKAEQTKSSCCPCGKNSNSCSSTQ